MSAITTDKPSGSHWDHIQSPAVQLAESIADMRAALRLLRDEYDDHHDARNDAARWEIDHDGGISDSIYDDITAAVYDWPLSVETIRRRTLTEEADGDPGTLDAVEITLGTGGPHVELVYYANGQVRFSIYWSGEWTARGTDYDDAVRDFLSAFYGIDS